jgi:hypothetical protein
MSFADFNSHQNRYPPMTTSKHPPRSSGSNPISCNPWFTKWSVSLLQGWYLGRDWIFGCCAIRRRNELGVYGLRVSWLSPMSGRVWEMLWNAEFEAMAEDFFTVHALRSSASSGVTEGTVLRCFCSSMERNGIEKQFYMPAWSFMSLRDVFVR